jgi:hypothetical protein
LFLGTKLSLSSLLSFKKFKEAYEITRLSAWAFVLKVVQINSHISKTIHEAEAHSSCVLYVMHITPQQRMAMA